MKNVIITGSSRGIGFQLTQLFAEHNFNVLAVSRNIKPLDDLSHPNIKTLSVDLSDLDGVEKIGEFVRLNWEKVDILINNAGAIQYKPFDLLSNKDFLNIYQVNVFSVAGIIRELLPHFAPNSHVVNISSMGGIQGSVKFPGLAAYSSSKAALNILTEVLAEEYKEKSISFNSLALGAVQTEMLEEVFPGYKAPLNADEMAAYIYDFALKGNRFFNGKTLQVSSTTP